MEQPVPRTRNLGTPKNDIGVASVKASENTTVYPSRNDPRVGLTTYRRAYGPLSITSAHFADLQRTINDDPSSSKLFSNMRRKTQGTTNLPAIKTVQVNQRSAARPETKLLAGANIRGPDGFKLRPFLTNSQFDKPFLYHANALGYKRLYPGLGQRTTDSEPTLSNGNESELIDHRSTSYRMSHKYAAPLADANSELQACSAELQQSMLVDTLGTEGYDPVSIAGPRKPLVAQLPRYCGFVPGESFISGGTYGTVTRRCLGADDAYQF